MSSTSTASAAASSSSAVPVAASTLSKDGKSPLLNAWHDPLANIKTNQSCVKLVDLNCDGDSKLCICDYDKKMRVYKGTNLLVEYSILETPIAVAITYMDSSLVSDI
jgi:Bardet-Biedl syndrome 1 protein